MHDWYIFQFSIAGFFEAADIDEDKVNENPLHMQSNESIQKLGAGEAQMILSNDDSEHPFKQRAILNSSMFGQRMIDRSINK